MSHEDDTDCRLWYDTAMKIDLPCRANPELWFSENIQDINLAKSFCGDCPLRIECHSLALHNNERHGVWGGEDFNGGTVEGEILEKESKKDLCRSGRHTLPEVRENNQCKECKDETRRRWQKEYRKNPKFIARDRARNKRVAEAKKTKIGGKCNSGEHTLTLENTTIRSYDKAIMCKECIDKNKKKLVKMESGNFRRKPV